MKLRCIFTLLFLLPSSGLYAEGTYDCTVKKVLSLSDEGFIEKTDGNYGVGKRFIVDKSTGVMQGQLSNNGPFVKLEILNDGNAMQSFAAITKNRSTRLASYIYVQEFSKNNLKPFFYVDLHLIYSGTCSSL